MLASGIGLAAIGIGSATLASCASGSGESADPNPDPDTAPDPATAEPPVGLAGLVFDDPGFDGQFLRALDVVPNGGADIGESFVTARRIPSGDQDAWRAEWTALADRVHAGAESSRAAGHRVSANSAYFRATTYYRTAGIFLLRPPTDPGLVDSYRRQRDAFQRGLELGEYASEVVEIPYAQTALEGYFLRPDGAGPFPTVVLVGGYDGTKEESYFSGGRAALRRGYAVLLVDGPGQGGALIEQGLVFRPDWEAVVTPQIDWLSARTEVDPQRIVLMGRSWGGFLAPRAATEEHRIAALIADAPQYAPAKSATGLLPEDYQDQLHTGDAAELNEVLEAEMSTSPSAAFALNRGMLTHGFATPIEYLRGLQPYTLEGRAEQIACPTLLCTAESDSRGNDAQPLYDAITTPKEYLRFSNAEGAGEHDEAGAATLFEQRVFGWLADRLAEIR